MTGFVSDVDQRRWGFVEDGVFIPVPKTPLLLGGLEPPVTFALHGGERTIIVEPACPLCLAPVAPGAACERCADPGAGHEPCQPGGCEFCAKPEGEVEW